MDKSVKNYITSARQLAARGSLSQSFDNYLRAFEADCNKVSYEVEFQEVLTKLNTILCLSGKIEVIFKNLAHALKAFPQNGYIANETGKFLYRYGFYLESWNHFQMALTLDPGFVSPERNLNCVKNLLVERWHFRMLNDKIRNKAYRKTLLSSEQPFRDNVLDIGTGTGLLAKYASHSATTVIACDGSETMCNLAKEILRYNDRQNIQVLNRMSTSLQPHDIGGAKSLIVTELFDAGLFGEHILPALSHAWENLLMKPNGCVIPNRAEFFIVGANCDSLIMKYQLRQSAKKALRIPSLNVHTLAHEETYDCDDVHLYKDMKYLTDPQKILEIDFNNFRDIQDKMVCCDPFSVNLTCSEGGELNVFIGWFNLYLTDDIILTTNPSSQNRANAWQQAVFFDNVPQVVTKDQEVNTSFLINEDRLTMSCTHNGQVLRTSTDIIRYLNDSDLMNIALECIPSVCDHLSDLGDMKIIDVLDLSPFPLIGLFLLKKESRSLTCCAKNDADKLFIQQVFQANEVPLSKLIILTGDWDYKYFDEEKYHAIICNILELSGDIDVSLRQLAKELKLNNLEKGGLIFPSKVTLMGQLISCDWLDLNNRVLDENVPDYKVAQHINKYQVSQNICLNYSHIDYKSLSDVHELGDWMSEISSDVIDIPIINSGECNAILCWYKIELFKKYCISTNKTNSFIDCIAFLAYPKVAMHTGDVGNILRCVDPEGSFKLIIDVE